MQSNQEFTLGDWHVMPLRGVIEGPEGERRLTPKAVDVLLCMARRPGEVVERDLFLQEVWHGRAGSDEPLNKCIAELRRQLGDPRASPRYIETIPKRGYRLIATPVATAAEAEATDVPIPGPAARRPLRLMAGLGLLAVLALLVISIGRFERPAGGNRGTVGIAVLPFASIGAEPTPAYFAEGMHEDLITALAQNPALAVKSRGITAAFRERTVSAAEVAAELDVDMLVTGSLRQDRDRLRVSAQLVDARDDVQLWSGSFDENLSVAEIFSIQGEIARQITVALNLTLSADPATDDRGLPTDSLVAYDHFMLGKYHYRRQLPGDIRLAVENFEASTALDPGFAVAWDWLAYAYNHAATGVGYLTPAEAYPRARMAALRALDIEPDLATAVSILGYIRAVFDWDWTGAVADLERALDLDPDDSGTVWSLAHVLSLLGRHEEAIALARSYAARHPTRGRNHHEVANRLMDAGRFEEALEQLTLATNRGAEPAQIADASGLAYVGLGELPQAIAQFEIAVAGKQREAGAVSRLAHCYARVGREAEARGLLAELEERAGTERIGPLTFATVHAGLGERDLAVALLREAADERNREVLSITADPFFAALRDHPGFAAIVDGFALPQAR